MKIRVSGGEVAADVFGEGPPVVLTHGAPASSYLWREVARRLARTNTVHVWDLLGYGESRATELPTIDLQARTLAELIDHWGLGGPALVGHDIGGATVLRAHLVHRAPARSLALLDAAVLDPWITPFTLHMQRYEDAYRTMPHHVFDEIITTRLQDAAHNPMTPETLAGYHAPWSGHEGQQRWIDQVMGTTPAHTQDVVTRLPRIDVPTLVLWGANDQWLEPATADRLAAAIPGARKATISGAGHFLPEDNPQDTASALLHFLN